MKRLKPLSSSSAFIVHRFVRRYLALHIILKQERGINMDRKSSPAIAINLKNEELLELYLSLPKKRREERFTDTAHAAEITGLSVRTIQSWIESGVVRAIHIGKKYQIDLNSLKEFLRDQTDRRES